MTIIAAVIAIVLLIAAFAMLRFLKPLICFAFKLMAAFIFWVFMTSAILAVVYLGVSR
jgi:hypothetical protein